MEDDTIEVPCCTWRDKSQEFKHSNDRVTLLARINVIGTCQLSFAFIQVQDLDDLNIWEWTHYRFIILHRKKLD